MCFEPQLSGKVFEHGKTSWYLTSFVASVGNFGTGEPGSEGSQFSGQVSLVFDRPDLLQVDLEDGGATLKKIPVSFG